MIKKFSKKLDKQIENTFKAEVKYRIEVFDTILNFMREMYENGCKAIVFKDSVVLYQYDGLRYDRQEGVVYLHHKYDTWGKETTTMGDVSTSLMILPLIFHIISEGTFMEHEIKENE